MKNLYIGIDGTDSPYGGCTTWTASNIIDDLKSVDGKISFKNYPRLIRLNPNIPYKTRGNGAICLEISTTLSLDTVSDIVVSRTEQDRCHYKVEQDKSPGIVIFDQKPPPNIYFKALKYFLEIKDIENFAPIFMWPKLNRSHIGAIAAVASVLENDFTYELLAYRFLENCGEPRIVKDESIRVNAKRIASTFSSFDFQNNRELIAPSGPDPVFLGIRGDKKDELIKFYNSLQFDEHLHSWTIFQTNQGTNAHVQYPTFSVNPFNVVSYPAIVLDEPVEIEGGHIYCNVIIESKKIRAMFFEPTKQLRDKARLLLPGDQLYIHGNISKDEHGLSLHVEFMRIISLVDKIEKISPLCSCGNRMTSAGFMKGYKCKECGKKSIYSEKHHVERELVVNQLIVPSKSAQRHLTRPLERYFKRNESVILDKINYSEFRKRIENSL